MNPELLLIESDHDLRNSADFLVIDKIAKAIFRVPGIGRVQAITRPQGNADRAQHDSRSDQHAAAPVRHEPQVPAGPDRHDMLMQADEMQTTIDTMDEDDQR